MLCIMVPNWWTVSPEFFLWVHTRLLLSHHTCLVCSPSLCVQEKLLFSTFLTRNEGTTDESKKRLGCYQQEQFNLPREYSVFDSSQCIVNNRKQNNMHRTFLYISSPSTARLPVKMPNFMFCEGCKWAMTKFILFMNLDMVERNSAPDKFACIWQSRQVRIIMIETEKNMNSLFHATFSWLSAVMVSFKNTL